MTWQLRHAGSPQVVQGLSLEQIVDGLCDGVWDVTDEVRGPGDPAWQPIENHPALAEVAEELDHPPPARHDEATSIDMNALIDVCLVLLIFFILTTSYVNMVQKVVPLPTVKTDEKKGVKVVTQKDVKARMIKVAASTDAAGKPVVLIQNQKANVLTEDGTTIDPDKLADALRPYVRGEDRKREILLDARDVSWETVIRLQDGARAAGIQAVRYVMRP